jgi:hypothetical protein
LGISDYTRNIEYRNTNKKVVLKNGIHGPVMVLGLISTGQDLRTEKDFMSHLLDRALGGKWVSRDAFKLFMCGAAILFWELVLIRWLGNSVRIVAYYSNFILLSSFLGLGAGALLTPKKFNLEPWIFPCLSFCLILGPALSGISHGNPQSAQEYIWTPVTSEILLPFWVLLVAVFGVNSLVFLILGQMVGRMFGKFPPLKAYSIEIGGSLLGIALFGVVSFTRSPPTLWFFMGFVMLFVLIKSSKKTSAIALVCCLSVFFIGGAYQKNYFWSPYYKIHLTPLYTVMDSETKRPIDVSKLSLYSLSVNNDYHQVILNLKDRPEEHAYFRNWRHMYDLPYQENDLLPEGPMLIVGAGTGNDVSAALRNTRSAIDIVEIDPEILEIGRALHQEKPYSNNRVRIINDDARSHFTRTNQQYALIVFGLLDSHTLLSSYSSLRLDNFVYTRQSMQKVKELLLPGGKVYLTFATQKAWIHQRFLNLLNSVFDFETRVANPDGYVGGVVVYVNGKAMDRTPPPTPSGGIRYPEVKVPTDDWPFLYLKDPNLPGHYQIFMALVLLISGLSLRLLPKGERKLKLNYFFMGAAFFLIETTNIIKLSILYGSTWIVNILVFSGILVLVLLGNLTSKFIQDRWIFPVFALLFASLILAYNVNPENLLGIASPLLQGVMAVSVYMGAIFFASLIFAKWIQKEEHLYAAYGSNLLGAMVGGVSEYLSLITGFQFLILVAAGYYLLAYVTHRRLTSPAI